MADTEETMKCAYCRTERPKSELHQREIIFRDHDAFGHDRVARKTNWYCNGTFCGGNDQMGHEG